MIPSIITCNEIEFLMVGRQDFHYKAVPARSDTGCRLENNDSNAEGEDTIPLKECRENIERLDMPLQTWPHLRCPLNLDVPFIISQYYPFQLCKNRCEAVTAN